MCENKEKKNRNAIAERLLEKRAIMAFGEIDEKAASRIIASLLYLESESKEEITLYLNSSGGNETEILGIFDVMQNLSCSVRTVCVGKAYGLSALILAGGKKGRRMAYANSEIMLMQVGCDRTFGQASDIELETAHLLDAKKRICGILSELCGKDSKVIEADTERKFWLYAERAKEYGLIDEII